MIKRITSNWNLQRVLFCIAGSFLLIQAIISADWLFAAFGGYILSMGIFAFGCAAGNCAVDQKITAAKQEVENKNQEN